MLVKRGNTLNVGILSTDQKILSFLQKTIDEYSQRKFEEITVVTFAKMRDYLNDEQFFHILFVDEDFENRSAVEAARLVRTKDPKVAIILLTHNPEKVYDSFTVRAYRFFLKPVTQSAIFEAFDSYRKELFSSRIIIVKEGNSYFSYSSEEIYHVTANGKESILHLRNRERRVNSSYNQVMVQLPEEFFYEVHRGHVINMRHIRLFNPDFITMNNGDEIPISRRRKVKFFVDYSKFVRGHAYL